MGTFENFVKENSTLQAEPKVSIMNCELSNVNRAQPRVFSDISN